MNIINWLDIIFILMLIVFLYFLKKNISENTKLIENPFNQSTTGYLIYPHKMIRQCGISVAGFWLWYWAVKWSSVVVFVVLAIELSLGLWGIISTSVASFFMMDVYLLFKRSNRQTRISLSLVFFINLLIVFLKSGLSLSQAFRKAAQFGLQKDNPLAAELELIAYELDAGRDRKIAFDNLSVRTGVEALNKLAVIIKAGIEVGSPVGDGLQSLADFLRLQQDQQLTSRINRKALESTLPMAMVCFPMFFVLVFFPAGQQISEIMTLLGDIL